MKTYQLLARAVVPSLCVWLVGFCFPVLAACPFCAATNLSLRQRFDFADIVVLGTLESTQQNESQTLGRFRVVQQFKPKSTTASAVALRVDEVQTGYVGSVQLKSKFLILGVDPPEFIWSIPVPVNDPFEIYVNGILSLNDDPVRRLQFFERHLEHNEPLIAQDAYDEFAVAPYNEILMLSDSLDRAKLRKWLEDSSMTVSRKQLYYMLLSVCGNSEDAAWLERRLRSSDSKDRDALDALTASYLTLAGDPGLQTLDELFLKEPKREFAEVFSVLAALRFHATEGMKLDSTKVADRLVLLLDRADIVDLVIADLTRISDWRHLDRMKQLLDESYVAKNAVIRSPIINYIRACPLPKAELLLREIEQRDPEAVRRAKGWIPFTPKR